MAQVSIIHSTAVYSNKSAVLTVSQGFRVCSGGVYRLGEYFHLLSW